MSALIDFPPASQSSLPLGPSAAHRPAGSGGLSAGSGRSAGSAGRGRSVPESGGPGGSSHRPVVPSSLAPLTTGSAAALVRQARAGVAEAQHEPDPAQRFATAYLAALRAAAAMLALRGRPHRGRSRPTSAWVLLTKLAPELSEWAAFFASGSATRAAIVAGVTRRVTDRAADDLVRQAAQFTDLIAEAVAGRDPDPAGHERD